MWVTLLSGYDTTLLQALQNITDKLLFLWNKNLNQDVKLSIEWAILWLLYILGA